MTYTECGGWKKGWSVGFVLLGERLQRSADDSIAAVNRLEDVEVELFPARHTDVEAVALDRLVNPLRVNRENLLRAFKRRVVQRAAVHRAENGLFLFGERVRRAREESRREQFDLRHVVGLDDASAQTGAAVRNAPAFLVAREFAVESDGLQAQLLAALPDQRPTAAAGDAFAMPVGLRRAVDLRAGGNDQLARVIDVLRDKANDGRLNRGRV